jgi:signal transduction histidine kinase
VQKAFEPFYTTARGKGGSGLGLNVVHSLVTQKLGGEIKIDSSIDKGCTFSITFPAKRQKVD